MATNLLRYSGLSILDTCLWLWRNRMLHPNNAVLARAFNKLDLSIRNLLISSFSHIDVVVPKYYQLSGKKPSDLEVFRTSFFFNEISDVAIWRSHLSKLIFTEEPAVPVLITDAASSEIESSIQSITLKPHSYRTAVVNLKKWELSFLSPSEEVCDQEFLKTVLVSASLSRLTQEIFPIADEIANLIASTQNIQLYVSVTVLDFLGRQAALQNSSLLQFVAQEMIYRKVRTPDNELERRLSFMKMMNQDSYKSILVYINSHLDSNRESAFLLARVCTRGFLERLFLIMTSLKDVLECRLEIAEWLDQHSSDNDSSLEEERDALRRELSNLEARSDLDSTRVHVDEDSFRDWFNETQKVQVARYSQTVLAEGPDREFGSLLTIYAHQERTTLRSTANQDEETEDLSADTRIGSEHLLVSIIDAALRAFAFDRSFGLDAYLSRRIRHGTLSGHVVTPLTRILNRILNQSGLFRELQQVADIDPITSTSTEWRRILVTSLDDLRKEVIQLQSVEHPKGLIRATWRTAGNIAHVDAMISRVRGRIIEARGSYDLFPDVYSLCWDCIEPDLAQLRFHMTREFLPEIASALAIFDDIPVELTRYTFGLQRELYMTLEARVQQVCGWFIRPVFRRDRYSLRMLVSSTLSIVRELDAKYSFKEEIDIDESLALSRGSFDVFGDVLFVLIGNGAKHGKADGKISVKADQSAGDQSNVVVTVISQVTSKEDLNDASKRIKDAFQPKEASEIDRAAVEEGFSGLRKVAGLSYRLNSFGSRLIYEVSWSNLEICFTITLPPDITLIRSTSI